MATLQTKTFAQIVQAVATATQARSAGLVDYTRGSIALALSQAVAGVVLWLQALVMAVLAMIRLSTSTGADADSFVADFGGPFVEGGVPMFARLGATGAVGEVTFSRLSTSGQAVVPVGATVETADGSQRFAVVANAEDYASYNAGLGGYVMADGDASVIVPVVGVSTGSAGNVLAGTVSVITSAIPGVDLVTNAEPMVGGADPESDEAMRVRFRAFIRALREATPAAILAYAAAVQPGLSILLRENVTLAGLEKRGFVFLVVDDGTGTPPQSLLDAVSEVVNEHRAAGVQFAVYAPEITTINVAMTAIPRAGLATADETKARQDVDNAVTAFLQTQAVGDDLVFNQLYQVAFNASPDVEKIADLSANGGTADIIVPLNGVMKPGTVTVS